MRSFSHWSGRYAVDRLRDAAYRWTHRDAPWLTPQANAQLESWLKPGFAGFEWGAGRSTVWLGRRVAALTSVEHDEVWYERVRARLGREGLGSVTLLRYPAGSDAYVAAIDATPDGTLDFALIDGLHESRGACAARALAKIRPGGLVIVDDVNRYLPSRSRAPNSLPAEAPPFDTRWTAFAERVASWPVVWTSDGVRDTAIWTRPGGGGE